MNRLPLSLGALALVFAITTPALAADTLTKTQMATAAKCKKLTPAAAKKNVKCVAIMQHDAMMSSEGGMMSSNDHMMSADKPK